MNLISLVTDFGLKDNFAGVMKGVILKINPLARVVDICHEVKSQGVLEAAFLLRSSFKYFPAGTVHLAIVDPGVGSTRDIIAVKSKNYFFVAPDNGILSLALKEERPEKIVEITNDRYFLKPTSSTFHGRDIFAPVAAYLSKGEPINKFGRQIKALKKLALPRVKVDSGRLSAEVIYIDRFGNLISNIDRDTLNKFIQGKKFKINITDKSIGGISQSYAQAGNLEPLALIDSFGYLEIALNCGSAQDYFGVGIDEKINIDIIK
jgi:S-adenosylmethionine hydrolase